MGRSGLLIFPNTYLRLLARELKLDRAGSAALLDGTGCSEADLGRLDAQVDEATQLAVIRNALKLSADPALGLRWGSHLHIAAHGSLGLLMSVSPDLETAWRAAARYYPVREQTVALQCEQQGDALALIFQLQIPADEVGLFCLESVLLSAQRSAVLMLGAATVGQQLDVDLGFPAPVHAERYQDYLRCRCHFARAQTALRLPLAVARQPNPYGDGVLFQQAQARCEELVQAHQRAESWSQRIVQLLRQNPGRLWTQAEVAAHFYLSPRTLIRYLKNEGRSYQSLLDEEMSRLACLYLDSRQHTVESVAAALGYQDVTAFRRAFKRWFGCAPSAYQAGQGQH